LVQKEDRFNLITVELRFEVQVLRLSRTKPSDVHRLMLGTVSSLIVVHPTDNVLGIP
jgi:hypothetical protein